MSSPALRTPGNIWYAWQYTKAFATTPFNEATKPTVKRAAKSAGLSLSSVAAAGVVATYVLPYLTIVLAAIPFGVVAAPFVVGAIGLTTGFVFGRKAYNACSALKNSYVVRNFIGTRKAQWDSRPSLGSRIMGRIAQGVSAVAYTAALAGAGVGGVAALEYAGVISTTLLATLGTVAALPVTLGVIAAAIPLGVIVGRLCHQKAQNLLGVETGEKKSLLSRIPLLSRLSRSAERSGESLNKSITKGFTAVTRKVVAEMTDKQKQNAAARLAKFVR